MEFKPVSEVFSKRQANSESSIIFFSQEQVDHWTAMTEELKRVAGRVDYMKDSYQM